MAFDTELENQNQNISSQGEQVVTSNKRRWFLFGSIVFFFILAILALFILPSRQPSGGIDRDLITSIPIVGSITKRIQSFIFRPGVETEIPTSDQVSSTKQSPYPQLNDEQIRIIASKMVDYIQSQRRTDGFYDYIAHYDEQCVEKDGKLDCPFGQRSFKTANSWGVLSYLGAYNIFSDKMYLGLAKADVNKLIEYCTGQEKKCLWVLVQPIKLYEETGDPRILTFVKKEGEFLLKEDTSPKEVMLISVEARELALLYKLTGDVRYLEEAEKRLQIVQQLAEDSPEDRLGTGGFHGCWYTIAGVETAKSANDEKYSQRAEQYLKQLDLFSEWNLNQFAFPSEYQPCIETAYELALYNGDSSWRLKANNALSHFINKAWDSPDKVKAYGEGGVVFNLRPESVSFNDGSERKKIVTMTDSAYSLYLLSLMVASL